MNKPIINSEEFQLIQIAIDYKSYNFQREYATCLRYDGPLAWRRVENERKALNAAHHKLVALFESQFTP